MMNRIYSLAFLLIIALTSCTKEKTVEVIVDASLPNGTFTKARMGSLTAQNGTPTAGMVSYGTDSKGVNFLKFSTDFKTELGTGTVTVYFSKSATLKFDPSKGNPDAKLIGTIAKNGEQYIKLNTTIGSEFTHLVLWCGSANVPFGNGQLN